MRAPRAVHGLHRAARGGATLTAAATRAKRRRRAVRSHAVTMYPLSKTRSCRHFANSRLGFGRTAAEDRLANPQVRGLLIYVDGPPPDPSTGMKIGRSAVRPRPWPPQTRRSILRASVAAAPCRTLRRSPHSAASSVWALRSHQTCHSPPMNVTPGDPVPVGWWDQQRERVPLLVDPRPASIARNDAQTG